MFKLDNFGVILFVSFSYKFVSFSYKKLLQCTFYENLKIDTKIDFKKASGNAIYQPSIEPILLSLAQPRLNGNTTVLYHLQTHRVNWSVV